MIRLWLKAVVQAKRLIQESQLEPWVPVHNNRVMQHWTAATDAVDHVILTAAALESVLEGTFHSQYKNI